MDIAMSSSSAAATSNSGYLEIILGSMYAGKTSRLTEIYKQCTYCNIPVVVINHSLDDRYGDNNHVITHDHVKIPCIQTSHLMDWWITDLETPVKKGIRIKEIHQISNSQVVLINEGQFFPDLKEFVEKLLEQKKKIYVSGLDGDFERKKFGQLLDLIPWCDKVSKLTSLCSMCKNGTPGIFSKRIGTETVQTLVGTHDKYLPVCRNCFEQK